MEQSKFLRAIKLFLGSDIVRKFSFEMVDTRGNCALFARANHQLSHGFAIAREKSAHFQDCFECLSLHEIAA